MMLCMYQDYETSQLKTIDDKYQYKDQFILNNTLVDAKEKPWYK